MRRRDFIMLVGSAAATYGLPLRAQQSSIPIVGWLSPQPLNASQHFIDGFQKGLAEVGFIEGESVTIVLRPGGGSQSLQERANDLVQKGVSAIMAGPPPAALAARRATPTIPIVFTSGADPMKLGLVSSYNRPGGNATGFHIQFIQLVEKRLSLLHELVPGVSRIALLVNPANPNAETIERNATNAANVLSREFKIFRADTVDQISTAFKNLVDWRAGAVFVGPDPFYYRQNAQIASLAMRYKLPISSMESSFVDVGGLMSYGPNLTDIYRQAGVFIGRILKGEKPAEIPVQQPTNFETAINLNTAKALDITIPQSIMLSADKVVE
ncbi:MAG: putative ABC transport system substrate-binding protein [Kiritimatiellia bacterium]|jgi:putative ABC transport system substrate-binding protein